MLNRIKVKIISLIVLILLFFSINLAIGQEVLLFPTKSGTTSARSVVQNPANFHKNLNDRLEFSVMPSKFGLSELNNSQIAVYTSLGKAVKFGSSIEGRHFEQYSNLGYSFTFASQVDTAILIAIGGDYEYARYKNIGSSGYGGLHLAASVEAFEHLHIAVAITNLLRKTFSDPTSYSIGICSAIEGNVLLDYSFSINSNRRISNNFSLLHLYNQSISYGIEFYSLFSQIAGIASIGLDSNGTFMKVALSRHRKLGWTANASLSFEI